MIEVTDQIWLGSSKDEELADLEEDGITAILNVACDLPRSRHGSCQEYAQIGLIDGPGNPLSLYCAAVLCLAGMLERHEKVLVCCHSGRARALAVVVMYLILVGGRVSEHVSMPHVWKTWNRVLADLRRSSGMDFAEPHKAHREAADKLYYGILETLV